MAFRKNGKGPNHREETDDLENSDGQHRAAKERPGPEHKRVYSRRLEIPDVAIGHPSPHQEIGDDRKDPLIPAILEQKQLEEKGGGEAKEMRKRP